jgi:phage tail tube protein FII
LLNEAWFDINETYTLVTTSYLAGGFDGFVSFKNGVNHADEDCSTKILDTVRQFFKRTSADWNFTQIVNSKVTQVDEEYR